ncbi:MAG: histidinol-phosphate aminotransferase [Saprospiraceae bacterium]|nr:MAG: histidinol-phosphate aminotransferase [Saprospiraceae bacterium]
MIDLDQLVRKNILGLKPYSSARSEFKGSAEVFLDANENPYETGLNRYPDPLQWALKDKIAVLKGLPAARIFLGNGSDEAIDLLIRIFCEPRRDHILTLPPTYGMYQVSADIADVLVREIPLRTDFQPDVPAILGAVNEQSRLLFLCSPNNPTGNSMEPDLVQQLIDGFPGIVVIDEAYIDFSARESFVQLLDRAPNLVVLQTFSKAWGLAGIRLGMAFASEAIIHYFNKVKPPYNVNQLTQKAALAALNQQEQFDQWVAALLAERNKLTDQLGHLDFVQNIYPSDANFLLVKVDGAVGLYRYLVHEKIIVRDRSRVLLCEDCLRITVGRPEENRRLMGCLSNWKAHK